MKVIGMSLEQLLIASSKPQDRRQQNCMIRIVRVDSWPFSGHDVSTTV